MRIAHVVEGYDPDLLYQEGYLVREQLRRGHDVFVLARHFRGAEVQPVRIVRGNLPMMVARLSLALRHTRADVVHVHNVVAQTSIVACMLKPLLGYRLVLDSHHSKLNTRVDDRSRRIGKVLFRHTAARVVLREVDAIFAVGGPERSFTAELLGCHEEEIDIVPLGVDIDLFHPDTVDRATARSRLGLGADFVVVHAGRLVPQKNLDALISATSEIGATALLIGPLDERVRPLIERAQASGASVVLPGVLKKRELASALRAADVGVWMGWPSLSAVEAMGVGLPLVTMESQHYRELLGVNHQLVANDTHGLTTLLSELRSRPAFAAQIGSHNAERAAATRSWTHIADLVEDIYIRAFVDAGAPT